MPGAVVFCAAGRLRAARAGHDGSCSPVTVPRSHARTGAKRRPSLGRGGTVPLRGQHRGAAAGSGAGGGGGGRGEK